MFLKGFGQPCSRQLVGRGCLDGKGIFRIVSGPQAAFGAAGGRGTNGGDALGLASGWRVRQLNTTNAVSSSQMSEVLVRLS